MREKNKSVWLPVNVMFVFYVFWSVWFIYSDRTLSKRSLENSKKRFQEIMLVKDQIIDLEKQISKKQSQIQKQGLQIMNLLKKSSER